MSHLNTLNIFLSMTHPS